MEEIKGVLPLTNRGYDKENDEYRSVMVQHPMGVVVAIDNEDHFKATFDKNQEVDIFKQMLSQQVARSFDEGGTFPKVQDIPYKEEGSILFEFVEVAIGKLYDGYVYVVHYDFASTVS